MCADGQTRNVNEALDRGEALPFDLRGNVIYYMGPEAIRKLRIENFPAAVVMPKVMISMTQLMKLIKNNCTGADFRVIFLYKSLSADQSPERLCMHLPHLAQLKGGELACCALQDNFLNFI